MRVHKYDTSLLLQLESHEPHFYWMNCQARFVSYRKRYIDRQFYRYYYFE